MLEMLDLRHKNSAIVEFLYVQSKCPEALKLRLYIVHLHLHVQEREKSSLQITRNSFSEKKC